MTTIDDGIAPRTPRRAPGQLERQVVKVLEEYAEHQWRPEHEKPLTAHRIALRIAESEDQPSVGAITSVLKRLETAKKITTQPKPYAFTEWSGNA